MGLSRKIAYIDLTRGEINITPVPPELRQAYIGGRGLDTFLLYDHIKKNTEPLSPDNPVVIGAGFLNGMLASASGWFNVMSKSPVTGYLGSTNVGEFFGPELRWAGFDHLVITGKSPKLSYLFIHDGEIELRDASFLRRRTARETQGILIQELDDEKVQTICIGPAGEKMVRFAGVSTRYQNTGGHAGIGAVFGSKNLKAVVVRGTTGIEVKFPDEALEYDRQIVRRICSSEYGRLLQNQGDGSMDEMPAGTDSCFGCQIHCRRRYAIEEGEYAGSYIHSPGYRDCEVWGKVFSPEKTDSMIMATHLVNSYGMDPAETAGLILWATELYKEGVLTEKDTGGLCLEPDDEEAVFGMIHRIGRREGVGDILAEGGVRAAEKIEGNSDRFLTYINSERRLSPGLALETAVSTGGSDDLSWWLAVDPCEFLPSGPEAVCQPASSDVGPVFPGYCAGPRLVLWRELYYMAADSLGICKYIASFLHPDMPGFAEFSKMAYLNTGLNLSAEKLWDSADRAHTIERLFNLRESSTEDDQWPESGSIKVFTAGPGREAISPEKLKEMVEEYYGINRWDENGVPETESMKKLGIVIEPTCKL